MSEDTWLQESVLEFFRSPLYLNPLMTFVDEKCIIFSIDDENPLEYNQVHKEFKEVVESLITTFLEDLGVSPEDFAKVLQEQEKSLNKTVLHSLLAVDDFLQFKNLMVQRNLYLQQQIAKHLEAIAAEEKQKQKEEQEVKKKEHLAKAEAEAKAVGAAGDKELIAAIQASMLTFEGDQEHAKGLTENYKRMVEEFMGDATDEERAMAVALADSLKVRTAMELEQAMLERAIAMSLGLEASAVAGEASTAAPAPEPTSPTAAPSAPLPPGSKPAAPESKALGEHDTEGVGTPAKQGGDRGRPQDKITEPPTPLRAVPETPDGRVAARREEPASPGPSAAAAVASSQPAAPEPQSLRGFVPGAVPMVASTPPKLVPLKSIRSGTGYRGAGFNSSESSAALDPVKLKFHQDCVAARLESMKSRANEVDDLERARQDDFVRKHRECLLEMQRMQREQEMEEYVSKQNVAGQDGDDSEARRAKFFAEMAAKMRKDIARQE